MIADAKVEIIIIHEWDDARCESKVEDDEWDCTKKMKKGVKLVEMSGGEIDDWGCQIKTASSYHQSYACFGCFEHRYDATMDVGFAVDFSFDWTKLIHACMRGIVTSPRGYQNRKPVRMWRMPPRSMRTSPIAMR